MVLFDVDEEAVAPALLDVGTGAVELPDPVAVAADPELCGFEVVALLTADAAFCFSLFNSWA
ncbi:hypothetical protein [Niabella aurantiaca]|uniref:hypothetical protein n=1 Tax=Niabella aurantiaca TaxID=379900 RepID=UPI0003A2B058|nr:hypothetical protein [Niabella aurantiaca]